MASEFSIQITDGKNTEVKVVQINGELDEIGVEKLKLELDPLLADSAVTKLVFDLSHLKFINSKGIGYLVSVHTHLTKDERDMALAGASEAVMDVLSLVGLTNIIPYYSTLDEALS